MNQNQQVITELPLLESRYVTSGKRWGFGRNVKEEITFRWIVSVAILSTIAGIVAGAYLGKYIGMQVYALTEWTIWIQVFLAIMLGWSFCFSLLQVTMKICELIFEFGKAVEDANT